VTGGGIVWPWLPTGQVQQLLETLPWHDITALRAQAEKWAGRHPHRRPPRQTQASINEEPILRLAATLRAEFSAELDVGRLSAGPDGQDPRVQFDSRAGRILVRYMCITPSAAAAPEVWGYMCTVLVPDLVGLRWPADEEGDHPHGSRVHGGNRNTFRRPWQRRRILGSLMDEGDPPLGEDELVNIFERSRMARDHRLARILAEEVLSSKASSRSEFARDLTRLVRRETGPRILDVLSETELQQLVNDVAVSLELHGSGAKQRDVDAVVDMAAMSLIRSMSGPSRAWVSGVTIFSALRRESEMDQKAIRRDLRQLVEQGHVESERPLEVGMRKNRFRLAER
jgi:hypothetical protein